MRAMARALAAALLIAAAVGPAGAQAQGVALALKFATGDQVNYDVTFSGVGSILAPDGTASSLNLQGSCTFLQRAVKANTDGSAVVEVLLPSADLTARVKDHEARFSYAGGQFRWFTDGKEQAPPKGDLSTAPLLKVPISVTMQPDGRISGVSLPGGQLMDLLRQVMPTAAPALPQVSTAPIFPGRPVKVGETWEQPIPIPPGPLSAGFSGTARRTLEQMMGAPGMELARISGVTDIRYRPGQAASIPVGEAVKISVPELRQTLRSTEFFSVSAGRLVRGEYDIQFSTRLSAVAGGKEQSGSVEARFRIGVTTR